MTISEIREILLGSPSEEFLVELELDQRVAVKKLLQAYHKRIEKAALERERFHKMLSYERQYYDEGAKLIAGVDEAGRGPLAGPLVIAAVVMPQEFFISGLNDSKQISASKRDKLYDEILQKALSVSVNIVSISNIDELNIYRATQQGMAEVLLHLDKQPDVALIDAMPVEAGDIKTVSLVHGDALSASIAAASIIAKVTRDRIMEKLDTLYPAYKFANNKGYGSKDHMQAIDQDGVTEWHRRSYEPVKSLNLEAVKVQENILYSPLLDGYEYEPQK
ncbi:MAG: ribonuclease HII [Phascolarctobacterium sp.]|jgi:ribonuclease HII|nr:ribonuclease HII [Phascolarctobacterium sp.]